MWLGGGGGEGCILLPQPFGASFTPTSHFNGIPYFYDNWTF